MGFGMVFLCKGAFSPKKCIKFAFFCSSGSGFINFDSQKSKFPMMFNMFVNMFWIAEGLGYIGVVVKCWLFNIFYWIFSLEEQKTN